METVLRPEIEALKAGKPVLDLPEGAAFDTTAAAKQPAE
jgi:hypothetical protein